MQPIKCEKEYNFGHLAPSINYICTSQDIFADTQNITVYTCSRYVSGAFEFLELGLRDKAALKTGKW